MCNEWSLTVLAAKSGLSKPHLSTLENDKLSVKASDCVLLRRFLELPSCLPDEGRRQGVIRPQLKASL
jgi:hypothetical protein